MSGFEYLEYSKVDRNLDRSYFYILDVQKMVSHDVADATKFWRGTHLIHNALADITRAFEICDKPLRGLQEF